MTSSSSKMGKVTAVPYTYKFDKILLDPFKDNMSKNSNTLEKES